MSSPTLATIAPVPRTWAENELIKAPYLRADVTDAVAFLGQRPYFFAGCSTGTAIPNAADTALPLNAEFYDNWSGHQPNIDPSAYFCQAAGWYLAKSSIPFSYTGTTQIVEAGGFIWTNENATQTVLRGGLTLNASTHGIACQACDLIPQSLTGTIDAGGDYIQFTAFQNSGGTIPLTNTTTAFPYGSARWVSALTGTVTGTLPSLGSWPTGTNFVTSTFMNANVRDAINFMVYPPILKAVYTPGTTVMPATTFPAGSTINLTTVVADNWSGFTTGTNAKYTAPVNGNYFCYGQINLTSATQATSYGAGFSVNGSTVIWGDVVAKGSDTTGGGATVSKRLRLTAGQTLQLIGNHGASGNIEYNPSSTNPTKMIVVWEGS